MNATLIIGAIAFILIATIVYSNNVQKKRTEKYKEFADSFGWEYSKYDKDNKVFAMLHSTIFYVYNLTKKNLYSKPFIVYDILTKNNGVLCNTKVSRGQASAFLPEYLVYLDILNLPKLFVISKLQTTSLGINTFDINYYRNEFNEIDTGLSTKTHIVIVNGNEKDMLSAKTKNMAPHLPEDYNLMIRDGKLAISTTNRHKDFQEFLNICQKINSSMNNTA